MKLKVIGALIAILLGAGLLFAQQPDVNDKLARIEPELQEQLDKREVQIDPAELVDVVVNDNIAVQILDVRDETDFNLFHIIDAQRITLEQAADPVWAKNLQPLAVKVVVSNDEQRATEAWKLLRANGVLNVYILEGGINFWLNVYDHHGEHINAIFSPAQKGDDTLRHEFDAALGASNPAADPDPAHLPERKFKKKVKLIGPVGKKSGGCG